MDGFARYKIPGGKLVEIRLEYDKTIERIEILGDFFVHPEESLFGIERSLIGTRIDEDEAGIASKITGFVKLNGIEMVGVDPDSIAKAIKMAMK